MRVLAAKRAQVLRAPLLQLSCLSLNYKKILEKF
jgi:hypothetical protein